MWGSKVLDVGIGVTLFLLMVSLLASAVREFIEAILKSRAGDLEKGLRELLNDPTGHATVKSLFDHPFIASLFPGSYRPEALKPGGMPLNERRTLPTYIPAGQFATAIMDIVARGSGSWPYPTPPQALTLNLLRTRAAELPDGRLQRAVIAAIDHADGDLARAKQNLATWFDGTMDRVSGAYKRRTQYWLFAIGLVAAILLNLDVITVGQRLVDDPALRDAVVAEADRVNREHQDAAGQAQAGAAVPADNAAPDPATGEGEPPAAASAPEAAPASAPAAQADDPEARAEALAAERASARKKVDETRLQLEEIGFPIGWKPTPWVLMKAQPANGDKPARDAVVVTGFVPGPQACRENSACTTLNLGGWFTTILGWLLTGLAVTFGAPFWFDILNKFMVIRSTVKPREKSPEEGSEDGAAPTPATNAPPADGQPVAAAPRAERRVAAPQPPVSPTPAGFEPETWAEGFTNPYPEAL
jgi:hypothetical protein